MPASEPSQPAKPGTACLGCRRRKLKCSREQEGCNNCTKTELPCVYPAPETGVKRKRGPYKKDKPLRERHLEHLVKYLEPGGLATETTVSGRGSSEAFQDEKASRAGLLDTFSPPGLTSPNGRQASHPEDLVKDALIALTKSSVCERESSNESGPHAAHTVFDIPPETTASSGSLYPPARQVFEYWHLFVTRVDPITKIIHCPTVAQKVMGALDSPSSPGSPTETLLFSVYYIAVSTCTANEARRRFGESRHILLQRYGRAVESALADSYGMPTLESVQAVILYMIGIRRQDDGTSVSMLFALVVQMAQTIGLHEDPGVTVKPFEADFRRRAWWHICGLESRAAEEKLGKNKSIQEGRNVRLPANLNDNDLDPRAIEAPKARTGRTDMSWVLMRWEVQHLTFRIAAVRKQTGPDADHYSQETITACQRRILEEEIARLDKEYLQHMHRSRPLDLMALEHYECILLKVKMIIECPSAYGQIATNSSDLKDSERSGVLQDSVAIIKLTYMFVVDSRVEKWHWFIRGYVQWHSLAIVVAELGRIKNQTFAHSAWAVLDPILADWDRMYQFKKGETAWDHVHTLISKARQRRHQTAEATTESAKQPAVQRSPQPATGGYDRSRVLSADQHTPDEASPLGSQPTTEQLLRPSITPQQAPTPRSLDGINTQQQPVSGQPTDWDFGLGFEPFEGFDQIDFQAFDAVFGGEEWEFPSPMHEYGGMEPVLDPRMNAPV